MKQYVLTGKQKAMVTERLKDPKASNSEIIKRAGYKASSVFTSSQQYNQNLKIPRVKDLLTPIVEEVEQVLIDNIREFKQSNKQWQRQLSNDNAKYIRDVVKGKAIQQIQTSTQSVTLQIDLTGQETNKLTETDKEKIKIN